MINPNHSRLSVMRQCQLLGVNRSNFYYQRKSESPENIALMNQIDEIYTQFPYYGSPRITAQLKREGQIVNHKRIERLMRIMGIQAIFPQKNTSKPGPENTAYPYLLNGVDINSPNHVWGTDITYVRANGIWFYLVAILDWFSRYVISWQLSKNLNVRFCAVALKNALATALPVIHNSDQGSQFTANEYLDILKQYEQIHISMDGRGRCFDNIFTERLWRTVKYEEIYLHDYRSFTEAGESLSRYFQTYNNERLHQSLGYKTPAEVYFNH